MTSELVVVRVEELRAFIREAVRDALEDAPVPAEWLDTLGAATCLGVHPKTVQRLASSGEIPSSRIGRAFRFKRADIEAYLGSSTSQTRSPAAM